MMEGVGGGERTSYFDGGMEFRTERDIAEDILKEGPYWIGRGSL